MDGKGPVKVVVRKTGLVPGAKTVDLNSLRKIIAKTQIKQLSTSRPIKAQSTIDDSSVNQLTTDRIRIKPDPEAQDVNSNAKGVGTFSPEKVFIKKEPIDKSQLNNSDHGMINTEGEEDCEGLLPMKRPKVMEQGENINKTDYSCCFCKFRTKSAKDYRVHIAGHLKNKVLNCNTCTFSTDKISAYNNHVRVAHSQKPVPKQNQTSKNSAKQQLQQQPQQEAVKMFSCSGCGFKAPKVESLRRHQTVTGHDNFKSIQKCKLCSYSHKNVDTMIHHIMTHKPEREFLGECNYCDDPGMTKPDEENPHSDDCPEIVYPVVHEREEVLEKSKEPKKFTCTLCDFESEELLFLVEHIKAHAKWCEEGGVGDEGNLPFSCTMCEYRCLKPNRLPTHMKVHGSNTIFRCKTCKYESSDFSSFKVHRKLHIGVTPTDGDNIYSCFVCSMKFNSQDRLQMHMTLHSKTKPFSCYICEFKCVTKSTLLQHLKSHSSPKKTTVFFPCPLCPNKYSTSASLRTHLSNHNTDSKPYQCDYCDYSSYSSELLRVHVQTHSSANRFRCEICLLTFPSESKLKAHIRDHLTFDKPLKCNICGTSFSSRAQLNRHLPIHSGRSDPFVCFACPQSFPSLRSRRNHMKMAHKIENEDEWKAQQPIVVRSAGQKIKSDPGQEQYGYLEEEIAGQSDSEEEEVHLGQHQFIGYPTVKE